MKTIITLCLMLLYQVCSAQPPYGVLMSKDISHDLFNNNLGPDDSPDPSIFVVGGITLDSTAERVLTFRPLFDDALIDTFWSDFKHFKPSGHYQTVYAFDSFHLQYLYLLRLMCSDSFDLREVQKVVLHHSSDGSHALMVCKIRSANLAGYVRVFFSVNSQQSIHLKSIDILPFDHSSNTMLQNVSQGDLDLIKQHKTAQLIDTIKNYCDQEQLKGIIRTGRKIETMKLATDPLFTWRFFMEKGDIWLYGLFQTQREHQYVALTYRLVGKRFRPGLIELIN